MLSVIETYFCRVLNCRVLNCTPYGFLVYLTAFLNKGGNLRSCNPMLGCFQ